MRYRKKLVLRKLNELGRANQNFQCDGGQAALSDLEKLTQCQEEAIEIGNCLECLGKPAEPAVHILEDYCESLYQQSLNLNDEEKFRRISKRIQGQLNQVSNIVRYDLPEGKKEILFLPYKASMWDSLESVWMAARDDESCEAVVMPIPYFDKNPDKSLGEMHDEKDLYPDYVPVVDWREYDISEHRPDAVFIHNPYDGNGLVTSVHPDYYAKELKKHTDMLVYIPYFVSLNNYVDRTNILQPGVMYADKVIIESEEVRNIYLKEFWELLKEMHREEALDVVGRKLVVLGSPKLDRVRRMMREGVGVPEEWRHLIYRADGSRKKVVLYNTSLKGFINHSGAVRKLERTFAVFKCSPDVALIWRPHPLLIPTVRNLRPDMYEELARVVQAYREEGWGIYDDTADVERAIVLSDAYYGDWSSVVTLYQATGRPIMIQDYEEDSV